MAYKLDVKDLKLLKELDLEPGIATSRLAKRAGVSQQVADYRLRNLIKSGTIKAVVSWVDMGRLGYTLFRAHVRFKTASKEKKQEFENYVFKNYKCFFIGSVGGRWDQYFDLFAETPSVFQEKINEIVERFREDIQEYETFIILRIHVFNYKYLQEGTEPTVFVFEEAAGKEKVDAIDSKILTILKENSRMPYLQIASDVKLSRNSVKGRIKKLHQRKIIAGDRMILNPSLMGKESYKVLLKLKNDEKEKQSLIRFARQHKNIVYVLELMGRYDFDLEIEIGDREKLQDLLIKLRNNFPIIEDYEIMPLFYDSGIDHYPITKR